MEEAGILLADEEYTAPPLRITIIGDNTKPRARKLYEAAMRAFGWYKVIEWYEPGSQVAIKYEVESCSKDESKAYITTEYFRSGAIIESEKLSWIIKSIKN